MTRTASDPRTIGELIAELDRLRDRERELRRHSASLLENLRHAELERDRLFDLSLDMVCVLDQAGRIRRLNPAWRRVVGYSEEELLARFAVDFVDEEDQRAFTEQLDALSTEPEPMSVSVEVRFRTRDGELRWLLWTMASSGSPAGHYYAIVRDLTEQREAEERFRALAQRDPLTRLPNRALFTDRLEQAIERARRYDTNVGVLFVDLDHFKEVNDQLGHEAGDAVLVAVADRMRRCVRSIDTVARMGGDEFVIVLQDVREPQGAALVAQRILAQLERPVALEAGQREVNASVGIAIYPTDAEDSEGLVRTADAAMYRAKEAGGADYRFAHLQ